MTNQSFLILQVMLALPTLPLNTGLPLPQIINHIIFLMAYSTAPDGAASWVLDYLFSIHFKLFFLVFYFFSDCKKRHGFRRGIFLCLHSNTLLAKAK